MGKVAVVLFNLGGPDSPEAVQPFLFNLFNDKAIIGAPGPIRYLLAKLISSRRAPVAREIYAKIGGKSPLLDLTRDQADALESALGGNTRVFIAMRYWHPLTEHTVRAVKEWDPDEIILLPLYPQFSTTTSGSSLGEWRRRALTAGLTAPTRAICCYPAESGFVTAMARLSLAAYEQASARGQPRVLFSAHGLPKKVVAAGDPYQAQVETTAAAVAARMGVDGLDWRVCYQSRVGPLEWISPATEDEIARAGKDGVPLVVVPIAFVSEHSETLVELDMEYAELAHREGVPAYVRVPAVGTDPGFIEGLASLVREARASGLDPHPGGGRSPCPVQSVRCACRTASVGAAK